MRNQRTDELAARLTTAWRQWTTIELSIDVISFINDIHNSCNNRMVEFTTDTFHLQGEGEIYHFYYLPATSTWACKA